MMKLVAILAALVALLCTPSALASRAYPNAPTIRQARHALVKDRPFLEDIVCKRDGRSDRCTAQIEIEATVVNSNGEESKESKCEAPQIVAYAFSVYRASHRLVVKQLAEPATKIECPV